MSGHWVSNLAPLFFVVWIAATLIRRMGRPSTPSASAPAAGSTRRRLADPPAPPKTVTQASPRRPAARPAGALPAEAAAAFPALDLSLGDGPSAAEPALRRRPLRIGGGAPLGSSGWGASAIVAMEVLGPPVALRPGATAGVPHGY